MSSSFISAFQFDIFFPSVCFSFLHFTKSCPQIFKTYSFLHLCDLNYTSSPERLHYSSRHWSFSSSHMTVVLFLLRIFLTLHWSPCGGSFLLLWFGICFHGNGCRGFVDGGIVHVGPSSAYVHPWNAHKCCFEKTENDQTGLCLSFKWDKTKRHLLVQRGRRNTACDRKASHHAAKT